VVLSSKVGFIPFDSTYPGTVRDYVHETFTRPGILQSDEIVAPGHSLAPRFVRHQIDTSLRNLKCATIDVYYLHNPETQLREIDRSEFSKRLATAFEALEQAVADGKIRAYGASSWGGFRVAPETKDYLSLAELMHGARAVGGEQHHFRAIMLPLNLAMPEAITVHNQQVAGAAGPVSIVCAARAWGLMLMAGSTLHRGRFAQQTLPPADVHPALERGESVTIQRALQFTRSVPGVASALVGMSNPRHVAENLAIAAVPPLSERQFNELFTQGETPGPGE
jgi:aryl-alcohol dehydrogenase-like predicted oxidoreductase